MNRDPETIADQQTNAQTQVSWQRPASRGSKSRAPALRAPSSPPPFGGSASAKWAFRLLGHVVGCYERRDSSEFASEYTVRNQLAGGKRPRTSDYWHRRGLPCLSSTGRQLVQLGDSFRVDPLEKRRARTQVCVNSHSWRSGRTSISPVPKTRRDLGLSRNQPSAW
jgi:hypothetical protein